MQRPASLSAALRLLAIPLAVLTPWVAALPAPAGETVVGRVRITPIPGDLAGPGDAAREALVSRLAATRTATGFPAVRVLSFRAHDGVALFEATVYDYAVESGFEMVVDSSGNEVSRRPTVGEPPLDPGELADAMAIVRRDAQWSASIENGARELYAPMPPVTPDAAGRRLVNVGQLVPGGAGGTMLDNEVVSVHLPTGEIIRWASGAPPSSRAPDAVCGTPASGCGATTASCGSSYHIDWPADAPVWSFDVLHPACTSSVQPDGTGLELRNVFYDGHLVLERAHMPVLNVKYDGDVCGPYRDWLTSENCFQAEGVDAAPGFRVTSAIPPTTFCESGTDLGNFLGVAIQDQGDALWLVTENEAGWYRYVMQWRMHADGTIEPIIGFGGTRNSCICTIHHHHAYWRFEWALDGTPGDAATGITTLERRHAGTANQWDPIAVEGSFIRPTTNGASDWWRVKNQATGTSYLIQPGPIDGSAQGDAYAKADVWGLTYGAGEINDPNTDTSINIAPWVNGEVLGAAKRLVTWYAAGYVHDISVPNPEPCEFEGPKLVFRSCAGRLTLDRTATRCSGPIGLTLTDDDLAGAGTATVTVDSPTEPAGETVTLVESPAGAGTFTGGVSLGPGAVPGDGRLSVVHGDTVTARYLDASHCGTLNVPVEKTAGVDCVPPLITAVRAGSITNGAGTIVWTTDEPATSIVHYGSPGPGSLTASVAGLATAHAVPLTGLADCAVQPFRVESADAAGNVSTDDAGGAGYSFTTARLLQTSYPGPAGTLPIPDNTATMASGAVAIPDRFPVRDVQATVNITHPSDGELTLWLVAPSGLAVALADGRGGAGDNFTGTTFDDEAATGIAGGAAPFSGSYRPEQALSVDDGAEAAGTWMLKALDSATGSAGTINSWSVAVTRPEYACAGHARTDGRPELADTCTAGGAGTGNGAWDAGEEADFDVTVRNDGTTLLTGVSAVVTTLTPGAVMVHSGAAYPTIPAGSGAGSLGAHFAVRVPPGAACGSTLAFQVEIRANEGSWKESFTQTIGNPLQTSTTVLSENFAGGNPAGWTIVDGGFGGTTAATWTTSNPGLRQSAVPIVAPFMIVDSRKAGMSAFQDEQLITPAMDFSTAGSVALEFDQYFRWAAGAGTDIGGVDVNSSRTNFAWQAVAAFSGGSSPLSGHQTIDITPYTAGTSSAQVRFHYTGGPLDWYWEVDNVKVTKVTPAGCDQTACPAPASAPPPVPDGVTGVAMRATRTGLSGSGIDLSWDVASCVAAGYHLIYGPLATVSSYTLAGGACGLGTGGTAHWSGVPAGNSWFVIVGENGAGVESSWGTASSGAERAGTTPSGFCGNLARVNGVSCP